MNYYRHKQWNKEEEGKEEQKNNIIETEAVDVDGGKGAERKRNQEEQGRALKQTSKRAKER